MLIQPIDFFNGKTSQVRIQDMPDDPKKERSPSVHEASADSEISSVDIIDIRNSEDEEPS